MHCLHLYLKEILRREPIIMNITHLDARLPEGSELVLEHVCELTLADPVPVHDDAVGLVAAGALVEHHEVLPHHGRQVLDDVLPLLLHSHCGRVSNEKIVKIK